MPRATIWFAICPNLLGAAGYTVIAAERSAALYRSVKIEREDRKERTRQAAENFLFVGAPHVAIIITGRDLGVYGAVDCGAYVSTFLLAAQSRNVATIPQAAIAI